MCSRSNLGSRILEVSADRVFVMSANPKLVEAKAG
jgi:hypothetical protein